MTRTELPEGLSLKIHKSFSSLLVDPHRAEDAASGSRESQDRAAVGEGVSQPAALGGLHVSFIAVLSPSPGAVP